LSKAEHGGGPVSHGDREDEFWSKRLRLPESGDSHRMAALETIQCWLSGHVERTKAWELR
jgi:hypothetical protein